MSETPICNLPHPELGWRCTQPKGHGGDHRHVPDDPGGTEVFWNDYGKGES